MTQLDFLNLKNLVILRMQILNVLNILFPEKISLIFFVTVIQEK
jgi:hypothetical protein